MAAIIDTSIDREIAGDVRRRAVPLCICIAVLALGLWQGSRAGEPFPVAYTGLLAVVLAAAIVGQFVELIRFAGAAVTISPRGVNVALASADTVPWTSIEKIEDASRQGSPMIKLWLSPDAARNFRRRFMSTYGSKAGSNELWISTQTLKATHSELLHLLRAYAKAFASSSSPSSSRPARQS